MEGSSKQDPPVSSNHGSRETATQLLAMLDTLVKELHPGISDRISIRLDSTLEQDLAIDSLARAELLSRIEQSFDIDLANQDYNEAETVSDLLRLIAAASKKVPVDTQSPIRLAQSGITDQLPGEANTLPEVLQWHADKHPDQTHLLLYDQQEQVTPISYAEFYQEAATIAGGLLQTGLQPGDAVALMLPTSRDYFISFFGILLGGGIPLPIYPPARLSQLEDHLKRHAKILQNAKARALITTREIVPLARLLRAQVAELQAVITTETLLKSVISPAPVISSAESIGLLQYTSGSTGQPKGVMLSHANLLANIRHMGEAAKVGSHDVFISWLPLYHDMGLIGAWLGSLYHAIPLLVMSPLLFLSRPHRWLWAIHRYKGTLSAAPNFAYELCLSKVREESIHGLDLSSWRLAFNGAEAVSPQTIRRFTQRFAAYGFRPEAMAPVYGLAESSVGLAFPPLGRIPPIDRVARDALDRDGRAVPVADPGADAIELVACGQPLRDHQIRIVDARGRELPERQLGHLQFQGPSATRGYLHNPAATAELFQGAWLNSGDLAYIAAGDVYLASRVKDIIIRAGRNIYPHELEEAVGNIEGVRKGCVAVFGSHDSSSGTERLIILAETRSTDAVLQQQLHERISSVAIDLTGVVVDEIILAAPHTVLKTSSGKVRRAATRENYEKGMLDQQQRAPWLQVLHLLLTAVKPQSRRLRQALRDHAYAAYAWSLFSVLAPLVWLLTALIPRLEWRWFVIRKAARSIVALAGVKLLVEREENLAVGQSAILVANHASYLDGLLLVAALPVRLRFVAKQELQTKLIPRVFLQRIGAVFVERFETQRSQDDFAQINLLARSGDPLLFFPEGTFTRSPGLLPFRMGAFVTAIDNKLPVLPIAIRGSRSLLRSGSWFPHRARITVSVADLLPPEGEDWEAKLQLRNRARREILQRCGEPDTAAGVSPMQQSE